MGEEPFLGIDALASLIQTGMMPSIWWAVFDFSADLLLSIGGRWAKEEEAVLVRLSCFTVVFDFLAVLLASIRGRWGSEGEALLFRLWFTTISGAPTVSKSEFSVLLCGMTHYLTFQSMGKKPRGILSIKRWSQDLSWSERLV